MAVRYRPIMSALVDKLQFVIRPSRAYGGDKISLRVAGNETGSVRDALKKAGFEPGDVVEVKLIHRGGDDATKIVVDPKTYVKPGQTWRVEEDERYCGNIKIGKRHFSDLGWECENLTSGTGFVWINDCHWTYAKPNYRMVLVDEGRG